MTIRQDVLPWILCGHQKTLEQVHASLLPIVHPRPRNYGGAENHWLGVRFVGTAGNRDGVGARVLIVAGGRTQVGNVLRGSSFLGAEDPRLFFGLGETTSVDSLIIRWPTGKRQVIVAPPIDRYLLATEE